MAISVADNFSYKGAKPLDARTRYSTVADMKNTAESDLYDGCLAYVTATKKNYQYDSSNTTDPTTGKWRELQTGGGGGASSFAELSDVSISNVSNGQVPKWNSTTEKWENANESGGGASSLSDLTDTAISSPTNGQALRYNSTSGKWENQSDEGGEIAIDMSTLTVYNQKNASVTPTSTSNTITANVGSYFGMTYYITAPIDVTSLESLTFELETGTKRDSTTFTLNIGLLSTPPSAVDNRTYEEIGFAVGKKIENASTDYGLQTLDTSNLTGEYYFCVCASTWNATIENLTSHLMGATLSTLGDVSLSNLSDGQGIKWNATSGKWENADIGGGSTPTPISVDMSTITSFLQKNMSVTATATSDTIVYSNSGYYGCTFYITQPIDVTDVSSITFDFSATRSSSDPSYYLKVGLLQTAPVDNVVATYDNCGFAVGKYYSENGDYGEQTLDTSALTGEYYFTVMATSWSAVVSNLTKYVSSSGGEGGHIIEDNGTEMTQRDTLNFVDFDLEDDDTNEKTVVQSHELTQEEFADIFSIGLPGAITGFDLSNTTCEANIHSTDERVIGQWIDGKPLYQKTITLNSALQVSYNSFTDTDVSATTVEQIVCAYGYDANGTALDLMAHTYGKGSRYTTFALQTTRNGSSVTIVSFRVQYTKTTDSAVASGEKIVGQWIDGKPIFEKVIDFGNQIIVSDSWTSLGIAKTGYDSILFSYGIADDGGIKFFDITWINNVLSACQLRNAANDVIRKLIFRYTKS